MSETTQPKRGLKSSARQRKKTRMLLVVSGLLMLGVATVIVLAAFEDNVVFFFGPSEVVEKNLDPGQKFRIGGLVADGSVAQLDDGVTTRFDITDQVEAVTVQYTGLLPDLFREGQGIVALGALNENGIFVAQEVLAKHDENYMPAEAVEAMKRAGTWQHDESGGETSGEPEAGGTYGTEAGS